MTEVLTGLVLSPNGLTPEDAAAYITEAWQSAVESIVETGRRLIDAKERVGHGNWLPTVELLPFSERTAQRLMAISVHPDISNPTHVSHLPASWGTLYVLSQLPAGEIPRRIEAREITAEIEREAAQAMVSVYAVAHQEALNAWSSGAVDGLTSALSYAKTWTPPADIPASHVSVAEFKERLAALNEIVENWSNE